MDGQAINPENFNISLDQLQGMTADQVLKILDTGWPWPLDAVQEWFENLYNNIQTWVINAARSVWDFILDVKDKLVIAFDFVKGWVNSVWDWINSAAQWIVTNVTAAWTTVSDAFNQVRQYISDNIQSIVKSVIDTVSSAWTWLSDTAENIIGNISGLINNVITQVGAGINFVVNHVGSYFQWIYDWLGQQFANVAATVRNINSWFSNEFIDPFIDWLVKLPDNLWTGLVNGVSNIVEQVMNWFVHESPGWGNWFIAFGKWWVNAWTKGTQENQIFHQILWGIIITEITAGWGAIAEVLPTIFGSVGTFIVTWVGRLGGFLASLLPRLGGWFMANFVGIMGSGLILTASVTGQLEQIIGQYVTPAITGIFDQFESMGPVAPVAGRDMSQSITKLATFTISGLAGMTLAGEALSPIKHLGLGHISAIIYDLINYKTLTAAFMGVLAAVYIKTPLTYYYNRVARPNIPDERQLGDLVSDYNMELTEYKTLMQYHGYPDIYIDRMYDGTFRALTPYMLRSLAEAGLLDDGFLDRELHHAGYREEAIPYIKQMMKNLAASGLASVSSSTAMTRFQEGFDTEADLRQNLSALGISDTMLDRYVFAANLKYYYDLQTDLKNYYIDLYHRREIEEPELRQDLTNVGINPERIDVFVQAQAVKRLKAPAAALDTSIDVKFDTIRLQRTKNLIDRNEEVQDLVSIGKELSYALAITDQDTIKLTTAKPTEIPPPPPVYETDEGKIRVDTIRRAARSRAIDYNSEIAALKELQVPDGLAIAIADNDLFRLRKETSTGSETQ